MIQKPQPASLRVSCTYRAGWMSKIHSSSSKVSRALIIKYCAWCRFHKLLVWILTLVILLAEVTSKISVSAIARKLFNYQHYTFVWGE